MSIQSSRCRRSILCEYPKSCRYRDAGLINDSEGVPEGWDAVVHPEGSLYFWDRARVRLRHSTRHSNYESQQASPQNIFTDAWLCDPEVLSEIEDFATCLEEMAREGNMTIPPGSELVLELEARTSGNAETKHYWTYYFVNHTERVLFWLHEYDVCTELNILRGIQSASHISVSFSLPLDIEGHRDEIYCQGMRLRSTTGEMPFIRYATINPTCVGSCAHCELHRNRAAITEAKPRR